MPDWVIVGAGSAGCVLANRLSEDADATVTLLEAGPPDRKKEIFIPLGFPALVQTEVDWEYWTEPQSQLGGRRIFQPRGKTLGGCSSINALVFQRGHRADFDHWQALENGSWGFDEVLPYFKKLECWDGPASEWRGQNGPLRVSNLRDPSPISRALVEAAAACGIDANDDYNGPDSTGASLAQVNQKNGRRCSAAEAYLRPALMRPNLKVLTGCQVTRIGVEDGHARSVEYVRDGQQESVRAEREVLLCGGAFNSPQLLMLSGIGPAAHLEAHGIPVLHDLPGVGQNLQDHLMVLAKYACPQPITLAGAQTLGNLLRYLLFRRGPLTSNFCEFVSFVKSDPQLPGPDLEIAGGPGYYDLLNPSARHAFSVAAVLLQPHSVGQVRLASADPFKKPLVDPNYLSDPEGADLGRLMHGVRLMRQLAESDPLSPYRGEQLVPDAACQSDEELEAFIRGAAETIYHPVGTCRMGRDPLAVVDERLHLHGIGGLRVVDASVIPTIVRGHPHATVVMLAEKTADYLRN